MLGAILSGLGSVGTGLFNYFGQRETNEMNERLTRESNAMNSSIAQENRDWQEKMWNKTNEYNSPEAQMSRLKAAGLNPVLAYGSLGDAKAVSAGSPPSAHMEAAHMEAPRLEFENPVALYQQVRNMDSLNVLRNKEIEKVKAEADSQTAKAKYDIWSYNKMRELNMLPNDSAQIRTGSRLWQYIKDIWNGPDWSKAPTNKFHLERVPSR